MNVPLTAARLMLATLAALLSGCGPNNFTRAGLPMERADYPLGKVQEDGVVPPKFLTGDAPIYPVTRLLNGEAGSATLEFTIDVDGHTRDIHVITATYPYFGSHAAYAVKRWTFSPATKDGMPIPYRIRQTFEFSAM